MRSDKCLNMLTSVKTTLSVKCPTSRNSSLVKTSFQRHENATVGIEPTTFGMITLCQLKNAIRSVLVCDILIFDILSLIPSISILI